MKASAIFVLRHHVWPLLGVLFLLVAGTGVAVAARGAGLSRIDGPPPNPAPESYWIQYTTTDLPTLQREVSYAVWVPQNLPAGSTLVSVRKVESRVEGVGVELQYSLPNGQFTLTQSMPTRRLKVQIDPDQILREVDINGYPGVIYDPGGPTAMPSERLEDRAILQWAAGARQLEMRGNVGFDQLLTLARSVAP